MNTTKVDIKYLENIKNFKKIPKQEGMKCFGCGTGNPDGLRLDFYTDELVVFTSYTVPEKFCGWENLIHGGITATIIDEVMSYTAIYLIKKFILTKNMHIDYKKPVYIGDKIIAAGNVEKIIDNKIAIISASIYNQNYEICAKSSGEYVLFTPEQMINTGLLSKESINSFSKFLKLQ